MNQKKRAKFNRNAIVRYDNGKRMRYVEHAHKRMLKENHEANKDIIVQISIKIPQDKSVLFEQALKKLLR